jgi:D-glycero-D-manno-heptose 1,7-bisphosphate phosphatase
MKEMRAAVFVDKDGTLIPDLPFNVDPARMELAPGSAEGLRLLAEAGYALVVVSNQSGVARGFFHEQELATVEERLKELCRDAGIRLDGFYYCPHHPAGCVAEYAISCNCRKPEPGLIVRAAREGGLACTRSWLVGDILNDIEAGRRAGCRTVLLNNGNEREWTLTPGRVPHHVARDLAQAAHCILTWGDQPGG